MDELPIKLRVLSEETMLLATGETIDNSNAEALTRLLVDVQSQGYKNIIIDMADLEFLSSAGVGAIFSRVKPARESGGDLVLCNVSGNVLYVLGELDVADHLTIKMSQREAADFCGVQA